ncbi:hypothetical protein AB0N64_13185 [Microbacterium sp. NPDC089318]
MSPTCRATSRLSTVCDPQFEGFVGIRELDSALTYAYFAPTADGWAQLDDRTVQCVLCSEDGTKLEGSAKGAES